MSQICVLVFAFLGFVFGDTSATCTEEQFVACLSGMNTIFPTCDVTEIENLCSHIAAMRQCLTNLSCSAGDVGYTEVKGFGNFSNYALLFNLLDAFEILCDARQVLTNPMSCVFIDAFNPGVAELRLFPAVDFNYVSWIGDHCGFLYNYYGQKYKTYSEKYNDLVAQIVLNATLKLYEQQQHQCPPDDGDVQDIKTVWACLDPVNLAQSPSQCNNSYCREVDKLDVCISSVNLSTWDAGYDDFGNIGKYFSILHHIHSLYFEGAQCACGNLPVLGSSCIWIDAQNNYTSSLEDILYKSETRPATYDGLCSLLDNSYEQFYVGLKANGYSENVARTLQTCVKKLNNFIGCNPNETISNQTTAVPTTPTSRTSSSTATGFAETTGLSTLKITTAGSGYGPWTAWSPCTTDCANRKSNRTRTCVTGNSCPTALEIQTLNCLARDCTESVDDQPQGVILVTTIPFSKKIESNLAELSDFYTKVDNKINGFCSRNADRKQYCCKHLSADVTIRNINPQSGTLEIVTEQFTRIGNSYPRETGNAANVKLLFRAVDSVLLVQCSVGSTSPPRVKRQSTGSVIYLNKTLMAEALNESFANANESGVLSVSPSPDVSGNKTTSRDSTKNILYIIILPMVGLAAAVTLVILAIRCLQRSRSDDVKKLTECAGQEIRVPPVRDYYQPGYGYGNRVPVFSR